MSVMTDFSFSLKEFVHEWRRYQEAERFPRLINEDDNDMMDDFNAYGSGEALPHNLSEKEFLQYFLACDAAAYNRLDVFFNGHNPSDLFHILKVGIDLDLDFRFEFDESGYPKMFASNNDMSVDFNAERLFDPAKETVHHDVMHVLINYDQPMGCGVGKQFLSNSIAFYDAIGYKKIIIPDPQQNGIIAWLKAGFRVPNSVWDAKIRDHCIDVIEDLQEKRIINQRFAQKILDNTQSRSILNAIARSDTLVRDEYGDDILFKELFFDRLTNNSSFRVAFDCGYHADLTKPAQRKAFDKYFKTHNVRSASIEARQKQRAYKEQQARAA